MIDDFLLFLIEYRQQRYDDYGHDAGYGDGKAAHGTGYIADGDNSGGTHRMAGSAGGQAPGDVGLDPQQLPQSSGNDGSQDSGADDGDAIAVMMALLDSNDTEHPALECLMTSCEEVSMVGARNFDFSKVTARSIINIDGGNSGDLGGVTVGCAAGQRMYLDLKYHIFQFLSYQVL